MNGRRRRVVHGPGVLPSAYPSPSFEDTLGCFSRAGSKAEEQGKCLPHLLRLRELGLPLRSGTVSRAGAQQQVQRSLEGWAEQDFLKCSSSSYIRFPDNPRSTIAVAFSYDGSLVASTQ